MSPRPASWSYPFHTIPAGLYTWTAQRQRWIYLRIPLSALNWKRALTRLRCAIFLRDLFPACLSRLCVSCYLPVCGWYHAPLCALQHQQNSKAKLVFTDCNIKISSVLSRHPADIGQSVTMTVLSLLGGGWKPAFCIPF